MNISVDIETGDLPREIQEARVKAYRETEFKDSDPPTLKLGNAKKPETIERKKLEYEDELKRWTEGKNDRYQAWKEASQDREREHYDEKLKWARLNAAHSQMLCYSVVGDGIAECVWADGDEKSALRSLINCIEGTLFEGGKVIGANLHGFDVPYVYRRALTYGLSCPDLVKIGYGNRYEIHKGVVDLLKVWQGPEWSSRPIIGLAALAHIFGVDQKTETEGGATFQELAEKDRARAEAYSIQDSQMVWDIAQKMGIIQPAVSQIDLPF